MQERQRKEKMSVEALVASLGIMAVGAVGSFFVKGEGSTFIAEGENPEKTKEVEK